MAPGRGDGELMRVAVAGGTGLVGRHVVAALRGAGHDPVVLARSCGVDLTAGTGLNQALTGVDVVVDVSNVFTASRRASVAYFTASTQHLLDAGRRAGVGHHVALSIVGVDRVDAGYYAGKLAQEQLVLAGPLPATVLRATQFHEFAGQLLARSQGPLAAVPRMRVQPVAAREVGQALVGIVLTGPAGRAPDLAGPAEHELVDLARQVLRAHRSRRLVLPVRLPGRAGHAMASGALLPAGPGQRGQQTFAEWLAAEQRDDGSGADPP